MLYVLPLHALLLANYPTAAHSAAYGALSLLPAPHRVQMQEVRLEALRRMSKSKGGSGLKPATLPAQLKLRLHLRLKPHHWGFYRLQGPIERGLI